MVCHQVKVEIQFSVVEEEEMITAFIHSHHSVLEVSAELESKLKKKLYKLKIRQLKRQSIMLQKVWVLIQPAALSYHLRRLNKLLFNQKYLSRYFSRIVILLRKRIKRFYSNLNLLQLVHSHKQSQKDYSLKVLVSLLVPQVVMITFVDNNFKEFLAQTK